MILLIDNYDSFTYNLYQFIGTFNNDIKVVRNDKITIEEIEDLNPESIVISPGPKSPKEAGICLETIRHFAGKKPMLGICLGHQCIGEAFGATVSYAKKICHGKQSLIEHPGSQNLKLTRKYYTEDMPDGRVKHIVQNITDPDIVPYIPDGIGNSTDRQRIPAVLIIPGGAFRRLVYNFEGEDVAKWLNSMGIAAFVLECRLPSDEHDNAEDVPLIDAMRAMRVIRGRAQEFGIDEAKIGVMGFSAGGFMAALLSTAYESDVYADYKYKDEYDKLSARPDFAVCSYPVISIDDCIEAGKRYMSEEQVLERISDSKAKILHKYNPDKLVRPDMPPVFICETDDDRTTLSENSVGFYMAARKAGVSAELHIFRTGGHGYGCGDDFAQTGEWKVLFTKWIKSIGIIS